MKSHKQFPMSMPGNISMGDMMSIAMIMFDAFKNDTMYTAINASLFNTGDILDKFVENFTIETPEFVNSAEKAKSVAAAWTALKDYTEVTVASMGEALGTLVSGMLELMKVLKPIMSKLMEKMTPMMGGMMGGMMGMYKTVAKQLPAIPGMDEAEGSGGSPLDMLDSFSGEQAAGLVKMMVMSPLNDLYSDNETFCRKITRIWANLSSIPEVVEGTMMPMFTMMETSLPSMQPMIAGFAPDTAPRVMRYLNDSMRIFGEEIRMARPHLKPAITTAKNLIQDRLA